MILAVGNTKGGVGKTTLAVNLAVALALAGRDLLLVDGDEQGTALTFSQLRAERLGPGCVRFLHFEEPTRHAGGSGVPRHGRG